MRPESLTLYGGEITMIVQYFDGKGEGPLYIVGLVVSCWGQTMLACVTMGNNRKDVSVSKTNIVM